MSEKDDLIRKRAEIDRRLVELNAFTRDGVLIERGKTYLYDEGTDGKFIKIPKFCQFDERSVFIEDGQYQRNYFYDHFYADPKVYYKQRIKQFEDALKTNVLNVEAWKRNKKKFKDLLKTCK